MTVATLVLQRLVAGEQADALLDALQVKVPEAQRVRWSEAGHARLVPDGPQEKARSALASRLHELADDWDKHIAIL